MSQEEKPAAPRRYHPLVQLTVARLREFFREPVAIFWVYGFPILMMVALGIAFRNKPVTKITVDVEDSPLAAAILSDLSRDPRIIAVSHDAGECRKRWITAKTDAVVAAADSSPPRYRVLVDKSRTESVLALNAVNDALQDSAGRKDVVTVQAEELQEPGSRYIDFLVPGLLGMNLMGGGLWGVGFVIVDMRVRKLLKRYLATPMKRSHFLAAIMLSRLFFMVPEVLMLLIFARAVFGVEVRGNWWEVVALLLLGAFTFASIGLLVASRAQTLETVSGLMNLVMLPMWVLSGIFFSSERFPDVAQPFIRILPLTPLLDALRAVMLEGESLATQLPRLGILAAWGVVTFVLALRWFRWQ